MNDMLTTLAEVKALEVDKERKFFSATHEEISRGATTDIYFVRTYEILKDLGLEQTQVVAEVFARKEGIVAGIQEVVNLLEDQGLEIWGLKEGAPFKSKQVLLRIRGPYVNFGLYETVLLGMLASSSAWATAAREAKEAAGELPVYSFGARHVHPAIAPVMERAAIVGGADGASCILGPKFLGQEPSGTVPHAVFLIVGDTVKVATAYNKIMPGDARRLILVDTFKDEAEESLRVAEALGKDLFGVRLDTPSERGGVTPDLVRELRYRLDKSGHDHVKIFVSGGLTPDRIRLLKNCGAAAFGVGSYISGASPIDMTMDLKEVNGIPVAKRGRLPGITPDQELQKLL